MPWMRCACVGLAMLAVGARAADLPTVEIAVIPYLPTRALLGYYEPLRAHLEHKWKRPVLIVTAPGFRTFAERTAQRQYPFIVTALHYARLAELQTGYQPLLVPSDPLQGLLVVRRDGKVHSVAELKGKRIVTVNRTTLISVMAESFLRSHGLDVTRDLTMREATVGGHHNAIAALLAGEADAAVSSVTTFGQLPADVKGKLEVLAKTGSAQAPVVFAASPDTPVPLVQAFRDDTLAFAATPEGQRFLSGLSYSGLRPLKPNELANIDKMLPELRRRLAEIKE